MPFMVPNNLLVTVINGMMALIESVYVIIFLVFAPKKEKRKILGLSILGLAVYGVVVLVSLFSALGNDRELFCGIAANIFTIIMYASPSTVTRFVIKTKSVEFMPFYLTFSVFLCGNSWFMFGRLGNDHSVAIPNGIGCGLGALQMILYSIYENNKGEDKNNSVEMEKQNVKNYQQKPSEGVDKSLELV